ncbi:MAG: hypothetical protein QOF32_2578 [Gammaproteobacteria bacterium]|nr:hypothetical protein [Gammaproteobacteria bacterium]
MPPTEQTPNAIARSAADAMKRFTGTLTLRIDVQDWPPKLTIHLLEQLTRELRPDDRRVRGVRTSSRVFQQLGLTKSTESSGDFSPKEDRASRFPVVIMPEWFDDIEVVIV